MTRRLSNRDMAMIGHAHQRSIVRLDDGREGRLYGWKVSGTTARILIAGRHIRAPKETVTVIDTDTTGTA